RLEAEPMTGAVEEGLAHPRRLDDTPRRGVDSAGRGSRTDHGDRRIVGGQDEGVNLALARARLADHCHACGVGSVTLEGGAEIEQHEVALFQPAARRSAV